MSIGKLIPAGTGMTSCRGIGISMVIDEDLVM
jgi:hypothetical protein